jgi:hypothetical protein
MDYESNKKLDEPLYVIGKSKKYHACGCDILRNQKNPIKVINTYKEIENFIPCIRCNVKEFNDINYLKNKLKILLHLRKELDFEIEEITEKINLNS